MNRKLWTLLGQMSETDYHTVGLCHHVAENLRKQLNHFPEKYVMEKMGVTSKATFKKMKLGAYDFGLRHIAGIEALNYERLSAQTEKVMEDQRIIQVAKSSPEKKSNEKV